MGAMTKYLINSKVFPPQAALPPDAMLKSVYDSDGNGIVDQAELVVEKIAFYTVTQQFTENEIFNIRTGSGSISGATTKTGDFATNTIGVNLADFITQKYQLSINGTELEKQSDVIYLSPTTFTLKIILDVGDIVKIESPM